MTITALPASFASVNGIETNFGNKAGGNEMMNLVKDSFLESEKHSIYSEMSNVWRNHCGKGRKELWSSLKCLSHLAMELGGRSDFWQKRLIAIQQLFGNLC